MKTRILLALAGMFLCLSLGPGNAVSLPAEEFGIICKKQKHTEDVAKAVVSGVPILLAYAIVNEAGKKQNCEWGIFTHDPKKLKVVKTFEEEGQKVLILRVHVLTATIIRDKGQVTLRLNSPRYLAKVELEVEFEEPGEDV